jgi:EAL domain-containing protein (putative c-di-GMP-specific phosphodiesterase class I)/GGDEF domain-containing protein
MLLDWNYKMFEIIGYNREKFETDLRYDIQQNGFVPDLLITDIRDFSKLNFTVGHSISDAFLKRFFNIIQNMLPPYVTLYTFGVDQFVASFSKNAPKNALQTVVEQIKRLCATPVMLSGVTLTVDVWVATRPGSESAESVGDVITSLSEILKKVKNSVYDAIDSSDDLSLDESVNVTKLSTLKSHSNYNLARIHQITSAVKLGSILPYAQAIVDRQSNVVGYEILARLLNKNNLESPDNFMGVIRSRSLMPRFTKVIFTKVLELVRKYVEPRPEAESLSLSFNIDFETLMDTQCSELIKHVACELQQYGFSIKLEVSEESIADCADLVSETFGVYTSAGIALSIDDFGTIYSNFHRVKTLSFAEIKVDKSFGMNCIDDPASALFIKFTKELSTIKQAMCVVEGVETKAHFEYLRGMGLERFQGYYFSKPVPLQTILLGDNKGFKRNNFS